MKVAILGTAGGWERAPWGDPAWEIWGLNDLYRQFLPYHRARVSRWFELHGNTPLTRVRRPADHWEALESLHVPVYTLHDLPTVTRTVPYPLAEILAWAPRRYFACTMAYQIALALSEHADAVSLYGLPLTYAREALIERPCVEWWLGYAEGRGVQVSVDHDQPHGLLRQPYLYAQHDREERLHSFRHTRGHHEGTTAWLREEAARLGVEVDSCENS